MDLCRQPLWQEQSLGTPLPCSAEGISVSLPLWRHVIGYEEKDPEVIGKFRSGYPRFCVPPVISAVFRLAIGECASQGESALVFPSMGAALRCVDFMQKRGHIAQARSWKQNLGVCVFPESGQDCARRFWRFTGEILSARQAQQLLCPESKQAVEQISATEAIARIQGRLAQWSGQAAEDVFLFPSGMAAHYALHRALVQMNPGRKTLQVEFPYVDSLKQQQEFGSGAHFIHGPETGAEFEALLRQESLAAVFSEVPSNPLLRTADWQQLKTIRDRLAPELPLVIDDTVGTLLHVDAMRVADAVTTSLSKAFSGRGDVLAGSVILNRQSPHHARLQQLLRQDPVAELWGGDAIALENNSRDFEARVQRMSRSAVEIAAFLAEHPKVEQVWHPSLQVSAGYEYLRRNPGGYGGLISFELKDSSRSSPLFYDAVRLCKGPSLGTEFSLLCPYVLLAHYDELAWAESCGVPRNLLRLSVGLEGSDDLIGRLAEALG